MLVKEDDPVFRKTRSSETHVLVPGGARHDRGEPQHRLDRGHGEHHHQSR